MSCYRPLKGFILGIKDNGKQDLKLSSYETDHIEISSSGQIYERPNNLGTPLGRPIREFVTIPCGRCIGCRLQYAKQWADRAVLELPYHDSNLFITLTYDDDHLPYSESEDGLEHWNLRKKDLQDFWKRLRNYCEPEKIKYLACGEYGDTTFRPHYHSIVFGLKLPDLKYHSRNYDGDLLYTSETLANIWKNGFVLVGEANHQTINYVARYVTKKMYGFEAEKYKKFNIEPPFLTMSRNPGLGRLYYEDHKVELFNESRYSFPTKNGFGSATPGRYFNNLFELDFDSKSVIDRKSKLKKQFEDSTEIELSKTSLNYLEYLADKEYTKNENTKIFQREFKNSL